MSARDHILGRQPFPVEDRRASGGIFVETPGLTFATEQERASRLAELAEEIARVANAPITRKSPTVGVDRGVRIALVVGHNEQRQGAYSTILGTTEYAFWLSRVYDIADVVRSDPGVSCVMYERRPHGGDYKSEMDEVALRVASSHPDLIVSLHFNSFADASANGAEALHNPNSAESVRAAEAFLDSWCANGFRNRGARYPSRGAYGVEVLTRIAPTILIEPFFGSNDYDCARVSAMPDFDLKIASAILAASEASQ